MTQTSLEMDCSIKTRRALELFNVQITFDCIASILSEHFEEDFTEKDIETLLEG